ncbi:hypothetical protein VP1G_00523 [Cytospora mali]|uniref:RRM domain-containing protein n=1 Tax=Cytospora mali TaxID=578113 RepID=A0A194UMJ1_CYTMA|nr:hypothetical protein VP1G_00523 [Valsa mali var. pyri (nom. inval.)]
MYIYARKIDGKERWIAVPPAPYLPFLLRYEETKEVERFVRLDSGEWVGLLKEPGMTLSIAPDTLPPLKNELYKTFGYATGVSPYLTPVNATDGDSRAGGLWTEKFNWILQAQNPPGSGSGDNPNDDITNCSNTTVFVGCLAASATKANLESAFLPYGEIADIKILDPKPNSPIKNGFVYFFTRRDAEMAMEQLQGFPIRGNRIRLSWGKRVSVDILKSRPEKHIFATQGHSYGDPVGPVVPPAQFHQQPQVWPPSMPPMPYNPMDYQQPPPPMGYPVPYPPPIQMDYQQPQQHCVSYPMPATSNAPGGYIDPAGGPIPVEPQSQGPSLEPQHTPPHRTEPRQASTRPAEDTQDGQAHGEAQPPAPDSSKGGSSQERTGESSPYQSSKSSQTSFEPSTPPGSPLAPRPSMVRRWTD